MNYVHNKKQSEKERYKTKITELVEKIEKPVILASVYSFIIGVLSIKEKQEEDD